MQKRTETGGPPASPIPEPGALSPAGAGDPRRSDPDEYQQPPLILHPRPHFYFNKCYYPANILDFLPGHRFPPPMSTIAYLCPIQGCDYNKKKDDQGNPIARVKLGHVVDHLRKMHKRETDENPDLLLDLRKWRSELFTDFGPEHKRYVLWRRMPSLTFVERNEDLARRSRISWPTRTDLSEELWRKSVCAQFLEFHSLNRPYLISPRSRKSPRICLRRRRPC